MPARKDRVSNAPLMVVGLGIFLIALSLIWFASATRKTISIQADVPAPVSSPRIPFPEIKRIQVGDAKAAFDLKQAVFIDTRGEPYFSQGHIPGALSITEDELQGRLRELDPNNWFITYCT